MMTLYTISDDRTKFCRKAMKAHNGVWNPVTTAWMFRNAGRLREYGVRTLPRDPPKRGEARDAAGDGGRRHRRGKPGTSTRSSTRRTTRRSRAMVLRAC